MGPEPRSGVYGEDTFRKALGLKGEQVSLFARLTATAAGGKVHFGSLAVFLPDTEWQELFGQATVAEPAPKGGRDASGLLVETSQLVASSFLRALGNRYDIVFLPTSPEILHASPDGALERFKDWLPGICERFVIGGFEAAVAPGSGPTGPANDPVAEFPDLPVSAMVFGGLGLAVGHVAPAEESRARARVSIVIALEPLCDAISAPAPRPQNPPRVMV
ncbi:MAG TPA: hypothetical protein VI893_00380, partial [Thermoplasmata archaeon]|nr:hypothetical protein [Thermoplasmata archaeon]